MVGSKRRIARRPKREHPQSFRFSRAWPQLARVPERLPFQHRLSATAKTSYFVESHPSPSTGNNMRSPSPAPRQGFPEPAAITACRIVFLSDRRQ
jgi:hypothetical protein